MELEFPIHYVIVVGFHHKKGCQVEYSYPPFDFDLDTSPWRHLPTLAMPDGAHNFSSDTAFFHLPSLKHPRKTVFGVACYRQIDAEKVKNKGEDVTRSTVQKSVCVLSRYPLYGHIQVKMSLITAAYFREGDFGNVSILEEAYHNLNACLSPTLLATPEAFVGLSPRDLVFTFRHQLLSLFKLLLLEKRLLFRGPSVGPLCSSLLTLVSLLPVTLEYGLDESACPAPEIRSPIATLEPSTSDEKKDPEKPSPTPPHKKLKDAINEGKLIQGSVSCRGCVSSDAADSTSNVRPYLPQALSSGSLKSLTQGQDDSATVESPSVEKEVGPDFLTAVQMSPVDAGLPLPLFTNGYLCCPYLSLHYMDMLTSARGFVAGATNVLFSQRRSLIDVLVELPPTASSQTTIVSIDIIDPELKKVAALTTQDLRFIDLITRSVEGDGRKGNSSDDGDSFMDGVGWEGGDEWIRAQFKFYLLSLLRTSATESDNHSVRDAFGRDYLMALESTRAWKEWKNYVDSDERETPGIYALAPGHPCDGGNFSIHDMRLKFASLLNGRSTTDSKKINVAVGKAGKAVGGALTSAKGVLSSWWSSVVTSAPVSSSTDEVKNVSTETSSPTQVSSSAPAPAPVGEEMETSFGEDVSEVTDSGTANRISFSFQ